MPPKSDTIFANTPSFGCFKIKSSHAVISSVSFLTKRSSQGKKSTQVSRSCSSIGTRLANTLKRYFKGKRVTFFSFPLNYKQATPFQRKVWKVAQGIPYGQTRSYKWVAKRLGRPKSARAVGRALNSNPFLVIVPCHRVIKSSGRYGGFRQGLALKRALLRLECADILQRH